MSRPANVPTEALLATARWLTCVKKLSVRSLRLCHAHTATDRIAAVCRFVKAEARQRTMDAVAHGVTAEHAAVPIARPPARSRRARNAPRQRARSTVNTNRAHHQLPATGGAENPPRAIPSQHGPRAAVIAAFNAQAKRANDVRLQQIAAQQRVLLDRLDGMERLITGQSTTPIITTVPTPPTVARDGALRVFVRRCAAYARGLIHNLRGRHA